MIFKRIMKEKKINVLYEHEVVSRNDSGLLCRKKVKAINGEGKQEERLAGEYVQVVIPSEEVIWCKDSLPLSLSLSLSLSLCLSLFLG